MRVCDGVDDVDRQKDSIAGGRRLRAALNWVGKADRQSTTSNGL